jgi:hypothetical protein
LYYLVYCVILKKILNKYKLYYGMAVAMPFFSPPGIYIIGNRHVALDTPAPDLPYNFLTAP